MNPFQPVFDKQKEFFYTDTTKGYEWRMQQLNNMEALLKETRMHFVRP